MEPPQELRRGPKVVRDAFNELRRWVISQRPLPSLDCDVHDTPQGRVILPKASQSSGGEASPSQALPFSLQVTTNKDGQERVRVYLSTLAGQVPDGFSEGDDPPYLLDVGSSGVVYGVVTIDQSSPVDSVSSGEITSVTLGFAQEVPEDTNTAKHVIIGTYSTDDEGNLQVANARYGPIDVMPCIISYKSTAPYWRITFLPPGGY